jgi:hypothetical protein
MAIDATGVIDTSRSGVARLLTVVFGESDLVALIRAGRRIEARIALSEHLARRPEMALERRWTRMIG